jgi:hypothetical protein
MLLSNFDCFPLLGDSVSISTSIGSKGSIEVFDSMSVVLLVVGAIPKVRRDVDKILLV